MPIQNQHISTRGFPQPEIYCFCVCVFGLSICVSFTICLVFLDNILFRIQMLGQSSLPSSGTNVNLGVVESVAKTGSLLTGHRVFRRPLIIGPNSPLPNNPSPQPSDQYCIAGSDRTDHFPQSRFWVPGFRATTKPLIHVRGHYTNVFVHFYIVFVHCLYCICSSLYCI